jgi:hypothetical protein
VSASSPHPTPPTAAAALAVAVIRRRPTSSLPQRRMACTLLPRRRSARPSPSLSGFNRPDPSTSIRFYMRSTLLSYLKSGLEIRECSVRLICVGPDCPASKDLTVVPIPDSNGSNLVGGTHRCNYGSPEQPKDLSTPDAVVCFNPGLSCWTSALSAACGHQPSNSEAGGGRTPFLITTNTEMESYATSNAFWTGG